MQSSDPRRRSTRTICANDPKLTRLVAKNGFQFPLGAIPAENLEPREGYHVEFESSQQDWPDCYMFDIVVSAEKIEPLLRDLLTLAPTKLIPILDVRGDDAYREMDPYIGAQEIDRSDLLAMLSAARPFLLEDGHCGFGALSEDPLFYIYVDDHKIITVRVSLQEAGEVEDVLQRRGVEADVEPVGVDAVAHDHLDTLWTDDNRTDLLDFYGMLDTLRFEWALELNVDPDLNVDDDGRRLGTTAWRVLLLLEPMPGQPRWRGAERDKAGPTGRYAEVLLAADSLNQVDELVMRLGRQLPGYRLVELVTADRIRPDELAEALSEEVELSDPQVYSLELVD